MWIVSLALFSVTFASSQSQKDLAYKLQAVYLLNFLEFTEWPDSVFENEHSPIVLGVVGNDPFGPILDEVVRSEKIGKRSISVIRFRTMDQITACHAIFFCLSEREDYSDHLDRLRRLPTLTVSEIDGFAHLGGCISFYFEKNKLRFEINVKALKESGVGLSSKLLRFARIINPS